jgi:ABC-type transport system involved in multi-copper enzyme maturation permease subunit
MSVWAVIEREMREQSRRRGLFWIRLTVAVLAVLALAGTVTWAAAKGRPDSQLGITLFGNLQTLIFAVIWVVVPLLVADTISRERREGTLGLLFLTPLRAGSVVLGKSVVHGMRGLMMLGVVAPVLAVPMLMGGVTWREYLLALCVNTTSMALSLSAGLLASAWSRGWNRAMLGAVLLAVVLLIVYAMAHSLAFFVYAFAPAWRMDMPPWPVFIPVGLMLLTGVGGVWGEVGRMASGWAWMTVNLVGVGAGLLVGWGALWLATWRLRRVLQEAGPSARMEALGRTWMTPWVARGWFRSWMRRALDRNPVGWLEQYRTTARLSKWGWALALLVAEVVLMQWLGWDGLPYALFWSGAVLAVAMSIAAAGSFRAERESGAFELLLVTPLRERDLVWGRLKGIWKQFLPGMLVVVGPGVFWTLSERPVPGGAWWNAAELAFCRWQPLLLASVMMCLPAVGLYMSLVRRTFLGAWLGTIVGGLGFPIFLALMGYAYLEIVLWNREWVSWVWSGRLVVLFAIAEACTAGLALAVLLRWFTRRRFLARDA